MRLAVLSDIHGNLTAFEAVLADLKSVVAPDLVVHGGDLAANGARPAEIVDAILTLVGLVYAVWRPELLSELELKAPTKHGLRRVLFHDIAPTTCELLGAVRVEWLRTLPTAWCTDEYAVFHASPDNLWRAPLADAPDREFVAAYGAVKSNTVTYGHIHRPFIRRVGKSTVVNSGSVGLSYDGDQRACYVVIDHSSVTLRRVVYDVEREVQELRGRKYPRAEWLISILTSAEYRQPS